jgi:hypothetical protein
MTFPHVSHLRSQVPGDYGDPLFNLWLVRWIAHAAPHGFSRLWNTDIFHPASNTLAYGDPLLGLAPVHWLLERVTGSSALSFNLVYLLGWTLSSWFTYRLALRFTGAHGPSVVAALAFTFSAPRLSHLGFWQLASTAWMVPFVLLLLARFCRRRGVREGLALGAALGVLTVTSSYYGAMMSVTVTIVAVGYAIAARPRPLVRYAAALAAGGVVALVLVAPVASHYVKLQHDPYFRRPPETAFAAQPSDFVAPAEFDFVLSHVPLFRHTRHRGIEHQLFPGVVALALGAVGSVLVTGSLLHRRNAKRTYRVLPFDDALVIALVVLAGVVFVVFAFGRSKSLFGHHVTMPLAVFEKVVPGFRDIRAVTRFVLVFQCALAVLAAVGLTHLLRRSGNRAAATVAAVLCLAVLAETATKVVSVPLPTAARYAAVNRALAHRPPGVTVELPMGSPGDGVAWGFIEAPRMFLATLDWHDRVNGYSAFVPPGFEARAADLETFPQAASLRRIDELHVRYVILRTTPAGRFTQTFKHVIEADGVGAYAPATAEARLAALPPSRVARVDRYGEAWLVELRPPA